MRLIALDLDGTLEDSRDDMVAAVQRVRASLDLPERAGDLIRPWVNKGMNTLYQRCFDDFIGVGDEGPRYETVRTAYEADYLAHVADRTRLYEGVAGALQELSALGPLACVTNKPERISRALLEALGVAARFRTVVGGDSCAEAKPSPLMLQAAVEQCGFDPGSGRVFMIGDSTGDVKLGRAFGATTIWCAWGYAEAPEETPDHTAAHPRELPQLIR